ncbi:GDP-mannose mannosyl hydrolase [Sulfuricurvum sp.]|uniref:GDP-mannose mannosyl hydrolase n=1 Tax=Sulfuricurvum sp. TaxID=2025608 RepID=UPI00262DF934|nr:GDP-mannose mannosyl hydrolase [Sulfuricurvum sp.]MDD3598281.1 GDP-mannose mannosyl hydrolase [Sulfuricurvum sp.]
MSFLDTETFTTVVANTPLIAIDLIVQNDSGEILLGKRLNAPARGFWFTPGGRIYKNESLENAFERISLCELGISISMSGASFRGVYEHFYEDSVFGEHISTHYVVLAYQLNALDHPFSINDQHSAYCWQTIEALLADAQVHAHVKEYFSRKNPQ